MDIQKEMAQYENILSSLGYGHRPLSKSDLGYLNPITQFGFEIWYESQKAAKAQADQKIKLLLCDEHLKKCESPTGIFNSQYPDEEPCLICLAKQAKAQAVPEGFVLVPREMQWHKADDLAYLEWDKHKSLFCSENRDLTALQVEEFRLCWCRNKANKIMGDYKAMIEAREPAND